MPQFGVRAQAFELELTFVVEVRTEGFSQQSFDCFVTIGLQVVVERLHQASSFH